MTLINKLVALLAFVPALAVAQATTNLTGTIRDAEGAPLSGAVVVLSASGVETPTRTDETGEFSFRNVRIGNYALTVRRLGYEPLRQGLDVVVRMPNVSVVLTRVATLDTIRVKSRVQAVYGAVGTSKALTPITTAVVQIIGFSTQYNVDSTAHFFIPIKNAGSYMVRVHAEGYEPQLFSITVPKNQGVEVAPLLDPATGTTLKTMMALGDFSERARFRNPQASAIISHAELLADGDYSMLGAIRGAKPFMGKSLRFGDLACVFVDGVPKPAVGLSAFDPRDVEAVEAYAVDPNGELAKKWPKSVPCAETGMARSGNVSALSQNSVQYVVIWLRH